MLNMRLHRETHRNNPKPVHPSKKAGRTVMTTKMNSQGFIPAGYYDDNGNFVEAEIVPETKASSKIPMLNELLNGK